MAAPFSSVYTPVFATSSFQPMSTTYQSSSAYQQPPIATTTTTTAPGGYTRGYPTTAAISGPSVYPSYYAPSANQPPMMAAAPPPSYGPASTTPSYAPVAKQSYPSVVTPTPVYSSANYYQPAATAAPLYGGPSYSVPITAQTTTTPAPTRQIQSGYGAPSGERNTYVSPSRTRLPQHQPRDHRHEHDRTPSHGPGGPGAAVLAPNHLRPAQSLYPPPASQKKYVIRHQRPGCCGCCNKSGLCDRPTGKCKCFNCGGCCDREKLSYKKLDAYDDEVSEEDQKKAGKKKMC